MSKIYILNESEYGGLQEQLSNLIKKFPQKHRYHTEAQKDGYKEAVLACKSVLKRLNPAEYGKESLTLAAQVKELEEEIARLKKKLNAAENCIWEVEDHLQRGQGNDWAEEAIERYEKEEWNT